MAYDTLDRLAAIRAGRSPLSASGMRNAIGVCEKRAGDLEKLVGWPLLADSWRREAEKLRAMQPNSHSCPISRQE